MKYYILYNPLAGNGKCTQSIYNLNFPDACDLIYCDITEISDFEAFLNDIDKEDKVVICGGDGTLNRFINKINAVNIEREVFYFAAGSGNDFLNDINPKNRNLPVLINPYIKDLPILSVNGKALRFINGIGYGIDGYCCEERDRKQAKTNKPVNYTLIALKGLLFDFKPRNATVIVDGVTHNYQRVWMVPTMKGRFFGGGMMVAPNQDRNSKQGDLTVVVAHDLSKFKIVSLFLSIFKGKHIKYTKYVTIHNAQSVTVKFDRPCALQIDGETVLDVHEYSVEAKTAVSAN